MPVVEIRKSDPIRFRVECDSCGYKFKASQEDILFIVKLERKGAIRSKKISCKKCGYHNLISETVRAE